jgi:hypothetical protein
MDRVEDVRWTDGKIIVTGAGQRVELAASLGL